MAYPSSIDELTDGVPGDGAAPTTELDDASFPHDDHHRALAVAVEAVETELGTDPSGASADVAARFAAVETLADAAQTSAEVATAVAAEATLARNGDNITTGTVADARIAATLARDSEVTAAISAHESDTTSVHGITDTSALALTTAVVTKSLVDAKGDLLVGTANDTVARKAAGTNGYVLVAQSGQSDGLAWQAQSGLVVDTVAAAGTTETLDGDDFNIHDITLDENITFTFTTSAAVAQFTLILRQDGSGTNTVTWPASVKWHAATAPTILTSASAVHVLEFLTVDTGTTWRGFLASSNVS